MELEIITDSSQETPEDPMTKLKDSPFLAKEKRKDIHPDFAAASLAHATKLSEMMMRGQSNPDQAEAEAPEEEVEEEVIDEEAPEEASTQEPAPQPEGPQKNQSADITKEIDSLKNYHDKEIALLRAEIAEGKFKDSETRVKDLESKHQSEIDQLKLQIEQALNA